MRPINPEVRTSIQKALDQIDHHFAIESVMVREPSWVGTLMIKLFVKPGKYPVGEQSVSPDNSHLITLSPKTATHLHSLGLADLHMKNGEVKVGKTPHVRCEEWRENNRLAYKSIRMEDA